MKALQTSKATGIVLSHSHSAKDLISSLEPPVLLEDTKEPHSPLNLAHKPEHKEWSLGQDILRIAGDGVQPMHKPLCDDGLMSH